MKDPIHVIPLNDLKGHQQSARCKCEPRVEEDGHLVIHDAWDLREVDESDCPVILSRSYTREDALSVAQFLEDRGETALFPAADMLRKMTELPEMDVSLPAQVEWLKVLVENIPKLFDPVMQPIAQTKLTAALETLRWVQGLKGETSK